MFKKIIYYYSSLKGEANRKEFLVYFIFIELPTNLIVLFLKEGLTINLDNNFNIFYILLIINLTFLPLLAFTTRRLKNIGISKGWIVLSFLPFLRYVFKLFLIIKKPKKINI